MLKIFLLALGSVALAGCASVSPSRGTAAVDTPPAANRVVNVAIGASVPATDTSWNITSIVSAKGGGPSRQKGGEVVAWQFFDAANAKALTVKVAKLRLIGYSAGGKGQVLVHIAGYVPGSSTTNSIVPINPLYQFAAIGEGSKAGNFSGLVMLGAGDSVVYTPPAPLELTKLVFTLEAFANDDASVDVQVEFAQDPGAIGIGFGRVLVSKVGGDGSTGTPHGGASGHSGGVATPPPSGGCQFNGDCGDGFACGMDGKCRATGGDHPGCQNGGTCERNGDCCSSDCNFGHCRSESGGSGGPGDTCTYNTDCYSHNCGAGGTCKAN